MLIETVHHDFIAGYVANEHIDWTSTASNFNTTGTLACGALIVTGAQQWHGVVNALWLGGNKTITLLDDFKFQTVMSLNHLEILADGSALNFGNVTNNPAFNFLGSGLTTLGGALAVNGGSITSTTGTLDFDNEDLTTLGFAGLGTTAVTNERLSMLMAATDNGGICIDGDTNAYDILSGLPSGGFNVFTRTIAISTGTTTPQVSSRTHNLTTVWDVDTSANGISYNNGRTTNNVLGLMNVSGDFTFTGAGYNALRDYAVNSANFSTQFTGNLTTDNSGSQGIIFDFVGFRGFSNFNPASLISTDGIAVYRAIGGTFLASGNPATTNTYSAGTQTLEYIGGLFTAEGESGIADLPTISYAGKFSATDADTNIAIQVVSGDTVLIKTKITGDVGFFSTTPVTQNQLQTGVGATVDNVITELQRLGLIRQVA